jgi:hypothetical protein
MSNLTTRTVYGSELQTVLYTGRPFVLRPNTTLNEKLGILPSATPGAGNVPTLKLLCIGNGGHTYETAADGTPVNVTIKHDPTDAALYRQIPWVLRPAASDLSASERAKYALRRARTYNSVNYIAYYGRRLDLQNPTVALEIETITNGNSTTAQFVPSAANLSPTPLAIQDSGNNALNGQYVNVSLPTTLALTAAEVAEIINACTIMNGSAATAIISEIALVSGSDRAITIENGASFSEVIAAQVNTFIGEYVSLVNTSQGYSGAYNLGANEPLLRTL